MQIDIPTPEHEKLAEQAKAAGYAEVERYVTEHVLALAHQPASAEFPLLDDDQLQASLALCDRSMAEFDAGEGFSIEEAQRRTLSRLEHKL